MTDSCFANPDCDTRRDNELIPRAGPQMPQPEITPRLQRLALVNVCLGQFMSALDSRSVTVALPTLSVYFDVSLAVRPMGAAGLSVDDRRVGFEHGAAGRQTGPEENLCAGICSARRRFGVLRLERVSFGRSS